jgi:hypothetical protein
VNLPALATAILLVLMILLHVITRRRLRALSDEIERQRRLLEVINERQHGPPPLPGLPLPPPRPPTARYTPRGTQRLPEPSPSGGQRHVEASPPRGMARLGDPSPRSSNRIPDPSPRASPRLSELSPRSSQSLPERAGGSGWAPTHRITFTPDQGRGESWLVMITAAPAAGRIASTKAEWSAGVDPAWHCDAAGTWTYRGQRTPAGARGSVKVEEFRPEG